MLPWRHTELFGQKEWDWGAWAPSATATRGIRAVLQSREVSIRTVTSRLPAVCYHFRWSWHGIGPDLQNPGQANTEISYRWPGASLVHELQPMIHPEICQGDPPTDRISEETRTNPIGKKGSHPAAWEWTRQAKVAFRKLKRTFPKALILQRFNLGKPIILQTDVSGFVIADFLNQ